jgi:hypothetical protein
MLNELRRLPFRVEQKSKHAFGQTLLANAVANGAPNKLAGARMGGMC